MQAKRILFPLEGFNLSGGIRIVIQVANGLAEAGHEVTIIVPDYAATPPFNLHERIRLKKVRTRGSTFLRKINCILKLCFISTWHADVSFATGYRTPYYLCLAKYLSFSRAKLVYLIQHYEPVSHAGQRSGLPGRFLSWLARLGYRLPLRRIAVSDWIKQTIGDERIMVISNGIDLAAFRPLNGLRTGAEKFTIGTVAGISEWKGHRVFLDAIEELPSQEKQKLRILVASQSADTLPRGVPAELIRPADENELIAFYQSCDVFVCSSFIEGFGLPPLEAMACGVSVITTDCGGVRQYASASNCLIVPPGDSKAIAESIVRLMHDRDLRATLREKALETASEFSLEKMTQKYAGLLSEI
jgi:glycosyltransferase involved in cell wall biosynthesis